MEFEGSEKIMCQDKARKRSIRPESDLAPVGLATACTVPLRLILIPAKGEGSDAACLSGESKHE